MLKTYGQALHAMQSGVAYLMGKEPKETEPKHLRVGVNSAMSDQAGLARLLIKKGVFTEDEYVESVTESMNEEADRYEKRVNQYLGGKAKLG